MRTLWDVEFAIAAPRAAHGRAGSRPGPRQLQPGRERRSPRRAATRRRPLGRRNRSQSRRRSRSAGVRATSPSAPTGRLVAFVRRRREARRSGTWPADSRIASVRRSTAERRSTANRRASAPTAALLAIGGLRHGRAPLGRPHREARPRARPGRRRRVHARVQPGRPDPRRLRLRARRVALGRCDRNPDRPEAHGRRAAGR